MVRSLLIGELGSQVESFRPTVLGKKKMNEKLENSDCADDNLLEVHISDLSITNIGFAIFLKPKSSTTSKVVPIFIGPLETHSISTALDGTVPQRPNTHDLFSQLFKQAQLEVSRIIIDNLDGSLFYASIFVRGKTNNELHVVDARPSDAIAIAIRSEAPIFIHEKVFQKAAVLIGSSDRNADEETGGSQIELLRIQLQQAVDKEQFEKAAKLRDLLKEMETETN